jgi:hypothetical protein
MESSRRLAYVSYHSCTCTSQLTIRRPDFVCLDEPIVDERLQHLLHRLRHDTFKLGTELRAVSRVIRNSGLRDTYLFELLELRRVSRRELVLSERTYLIKVFLHFSRQLARIPSFSLVLTYTLMKNLCE